MKNKGREELVSETKNLYKLYQALYILINAATIEIRNRFRESEKAIDHLSKDQLVSVIDELSREIDNLKDKYGVTVSNRVLIDIASYANKAEPGRLLLIPKYLLKKIFANYEKALPGFNEFPNHIRIGIDPGEYRKQQGPVELYLLESILFEDMCALHNLALKASEIVTNKAKIKERDALIRAAITLSFYFIEAYLNGLAFDYFSNNEHRLSAKEKMLLTEWDFEKKRIKLVSFRDKLVKYPKIILSVQHPPFTESNCDELAFILDQAKLFRDSIVHASPMYNIQSYEPKKELAFYNINIELENKIIDVTLSLIEKVEYAIFSDLSRIWWFSRKKENRLFPEAAFH